MAGYGQGGSSYHQQADFLALLDRTDTVTTNSTHDKTPEQPSPAKSQMDSLSEFRNTPQQRAVNSSAFDLDSMNGHADPRAFENGNSLDTARQNNSTNHFEAFQRGTHNRSMNVNNTPPLGLRVAPGFVDNGFMAASPPREPQVPDLQFGASAGHVLRIGGPTSNFTPPPNMAQQPQQYQYIAPQPNMGVNYGNQHPTAFMNRNGTSYSGNNYPAFNGNGNVGLGLSSEQRVAFPGMMPPNQQPFPPTANRYATAGDFQQMSGQAPSSSLGGYSGNNNYYGPPQFTLSGDQTQDVSRPARHAQSLGVSGYHQGGPSSVSSTPRKREHMQHDLPPVNDMGDDDDDDDDDEDLNSIQASLPRTPRKQRKRIAGSRTKFYGSPVDYPTFAKSTLKINSFQEACDLAVARTRFADADWPAFKQDRDHVKANHQQYIHEMLTAFDGYVDDNGKSVPYKLVDPKIEEADDKAEWTKWQAKHYYRVADLIAERGADLAEASVTMLFESFLECFEKGGPPTYACPKEIDTTTKLSDRLEIAIKGISEFTLIRVDVLKLERLDKFAAAPAHYVDTKSKYQKTNANRRKKLNEALGTKGRDEDDVTSDESPKKSASGRKKRAPKPRSRAAGEASSPTSTPAKRKGDRKSKVQTPADVELGADKDDQDAEFMQDEGSGLEYAEGGQQDDYDGQLGEMAIEGVEGAEEDAVSAGVTPELGDGSDYEPPLLDSPEQRKQLYKQLAEFDAPAKPKKRGGRPKKKRV